MTGATTITVTTSETWQPIPFFVITTGFQYSLRKFIEMAVKELGLKISWDGKVSMKRATGTGRSSYGSTSPLSPERAETLLGDPNKA